MVDISEALRSGLDNIDGGVAEGGGALKGATAQDHGLVTFAMAKLLESKGYDPRSTMTGVEAFSFNRR